MAILLVVAYHVGVPGVQGGFVGVDVFFVLSGYLITGLLVAEVERTGRVDLRAFYARRVRRLLPAAALMLSVTLVVGALLLSPLEARPLASAAVATALYGSNVWLALQATDYLGDGGESNPLLHTWSLAVEEQFYLVWPLLVLLALRMGGGTRRRPLVVTVAATSAVSLAGAVWLTGAVQPWAFFGSPTRAWEFGLGALAWLAGQRWWAARPRVSRGAAWTGAAALAGTAVLLGPHTPFPGWVALVPVLATLLLLCTCGGAHGGLVAGALRTAPMQWLGRLSYSWYLWHWPALVFAAVLAGGEAGLAARAAVALLALGVAAVTYSAFENPIRFHPALARRPAASLALGVFITAGGLLLALEFREAEARAAAQPAQAAFAAARDDRAMAYDTRRCRPLKGAPGVRGCVFGDTSAAATLVLFGDSHAAHWVPALDAMARQRGAELVAITRPGCPAARVTVYSRSLRREFTECDAWRQNAVRAISALRPDAVVMASAHTYVGDGPRGWAIPGVAPEAWRDGTRHTAAALAASGARVRVMRDNPRSEFDLPLCLSRAAWRGGDPAAACAFPRTTPLRRQVWAMERAALAGVRGASVLDVTDAICSASTCAPVRDGVVIYHDGSHFTRTFSVRLAPDVSRAMGNAIVG